MSARVLAVSFSVLLGAASLALGCASKPRPAGARVAPLDEKERDYLAGVARSALERYYKDGAQLTVDDVPAALRRFDKRVVFATFHLDGETRGCYSAGEGDVGSNVVASTVRTVHDDRYYVKDFVGPLGKKATLRTDEVPRVRIELNVLHNYERLAFADPDALRGEVEPGVHGVRLSKGKAGAYYLPYVAIEFEYDMAPYLRTLTQKAGLKGEEWQKGARLWRFDSENFIEALDGKKALPLYRWNVLAGPADAKALEAALVRAAEAAKGMLAQPAPIAGWHPKRKKSIGPAPDWLAPRAASLWPAVFASNTPPPAPITAEGSPSKARSTLSPADSPAAYASFACIASLAGAAAQPNQACDRVMALQEDGRFPPAARARFLSWERAHQESVAAVRALAAFARAAPGGAHLRAAKAIFVRAEADFGGRIGARAELAIAAMALHRAESSGVYLKRALAHADAVLELQLGEKAATTPDQIGAFAFDRVPTVSDAANAAHAFALLAAAGETRFRAPALAAARFVLHLQYRPESAFAFPEIPRYLGALRTDLHHVTAHLESTLDAAEAWRAVLALSKTP